MMQLHIPNEFRFELIEKIDIVRNPVSKAWELIVCGSFKAAHLGTWSTIDDSMDGIRRFRFHCPNARIEVTDTEFFDNTCRVRSCKWNFNDSCSLRQHLSIIPVPAEPDLTQDEWTIENNIMIDICPDFELLDDHR